MPAVVRDDGRRLERALGDAGYPTGTAEPEAPRTGAQRRPHLGPQARAARARRPALRARQLRDQGRDGPRADPARPGLAADDDGGRARPAQPRVHAALQQRLADLRSRGARRSGPSFRWSSTSRSATSSTASSTSASAARPSRRTRTRRSPSASTRAPATRTATCWGTPGASRAASPSVSRCGEARRRSSTSASSARSSASTRR